MEQLVTGGSHKPGKDHFKQGFSCIIPDFIELTLQFERIYDFYE